MTTSPIRAQPEGRARSDKTEGEVGGAQRAERASTDGCQRLTPECSEGAGAVASLAACPPLAS